jgi:hypothetical protein
LRLLSAEHVMALYFLHLRDGTDELLDDEGIELSESAVAGAALTSARDCIAGDAHRGRIELKYRIEVENERGEVVHTLPFEEAVTIVRA